MHSTKLLISILVVYLIGMAMSAAPKKKTSGTNTNICKKSDLSPLTYGLVKMKEDIKADLIGVRGDVTSLRADVVTLQDSVSKDFTTLRDGNSAVREDFIDLQKSLGGLRVEIDQGSCGLTCLTNKTLALLGGLSSKLASLESSIEACAPTHISTSLAQGRPCVQSSDLDSGDFKDNDGCDLAVDGNPDTNVYNHHCSHTKNEAKPWWRVDLLDVYVIQAVELVRTINVGERLADFTIMVSEDNITWHTCAVQRGNLLPFTQNTFDCPSKPRGRYVRVQLMGSNYLTLCEVYVTGYKED